MSGRHGGEGGPAVSPAVAPPVSAHRQPKLAAANERALAAAAQQARRAARKGPPTPRAQAQQSSPRELRVVDEADAGSASAPSPLSPSHNVAALSVASPIAAAASSPSASDAETAATAAAAESPSVVRRIRPPPSSAHRTSAAHIRRSAGRELKDSQLLQADLAFEMRLRKEVDGEVSRQQLTADWRERKQREMDREAERKRREEEEEQRRLQAGGKKRRKLLVAPPPVVLLEGAPLAELDHFDALLSALEPARDEDVDWGLVAQIGGVIGLPHGQRQRVWRWLLTRGRQEEQTEDAQLDEEGERQQTSSEQHTDTARQEEEQQQAVELPTSSADSGAPSSSSSSSLQVDASAVPSTSSDVAASSSSSISSSSLPSPKLDLINQRVIRVDIERTLPHLLTMQRVDVRHNMEVLLTSYCKRLHVTYKQGMNYVLAPFFFLHSLPLSRPARRSLSKLYSAFIDTFLCNTFVDDEFGSLQCLFLLFRQLLLYHDPQLCHHLDAHDMGPELYCSSWFITLYSNRCKLEVVLYLWDLLVLEAADDSLLHYFVSLALLIANRAALLQESAVSLPELLSKLSIASKRDAHTLVQRAKRLYRANTSQAMRATLQHITQAVIRVDSPTYTQLSQWPAAIVGVDELIDALVPQHSRGHSRAPSSSTSTAGAAASTPIKYFVLDTRPADEYESGHLPMTYHLDPALLDERRAEELEERLEGVLALRGCHFCLADSTGRATDAGLEEDANGSGAAASSAAQLSFLSLLLRRHVKYVSIIQGGFPACHARLVAMERSSELIDHRPDDCLECNGRRSVAKKERRTLLSSMRKVGRTAQQPSQCTPHRPLT